MQELLGHVAAAGDPCRKPGIGTRIASQNSQAQFEAGFFLSRSMRKHQIYLQVKARDHQDSSRKVA